MQGVFYIMKSDKLENLADYKGKNIVFALFKDGYDHLDSDISTAFKPAFDLGDFSGKANQIVLSYVGSKRIF